MTTSTLVAPYRFFDVTIGAVTSLSPSFLRVTFTGEDLAQFADAGTDQRIKIAVPLPGCGIDHLPRSSDTWYQQWRAQPDDLRNPLRTYTVAAVRADRAEIDVDVVRHEGGVFSDWLFSAGPGAKTAILGPNAEHPGPYGGQAWNPPSQAGRILVVGDETALPAVVNVCSVLPPEAVGDVVIEVPLATDFRRPAVPPGVQITWLARGSAPYGSRLVAAVNKVLPGLYGPLSSDLGVAVPVLDDTEDEVLWDVSEERAAPARCYVWAAAETATVREVRRLLVASGARRSDLALMGYWRRGQSET